MWKKHDLLSWLAVEKDPDRKMDPNGVKIAHHSHWHAQYIQCRAQHRVQNHTEYSQSQKISKQKLHKYIPSNPHSIYSALFCTKKTENTDNHELKYPIKEQTNKYQVIQMVTELPIRTTATSSTQHTVQSVQKHIKKMYTLIKIAWVGSG